MKCSGLSSIERLMIVLENNLQAEENKWKVPVFQGVSLKGTDISLTHYEQAILWIEEVRLRFKFYPETFALAVSVFNRMLASVKAQVKYLRCIAVSCLFLAAKTNEEDEAMPSVKRLAIESECRCSTAEIVRMERIILDKLQWDLYTATPVDFLNNMHAIVMSSWPHLFNSLPKMNASRHLNFLTKQIQHCMACHQLLQFRGSTLALVIITLELEKLTTDWFPVIMELLKKAKVDNSTFINCKEMVDQHLGMLSPPNPVYIFISNKNPQQANHKKESSYCYTPATQSNTNSPIPGGYISVTKQIKEEIMETDEFYDGFQYLYNENCLSEDRKRKEGITEKTQLQVSSPCPVLQSAHDD